MIILSYLDVQYTIPVSKHANNELLNKADVPGVKIKALGYLAIEVYRCVDDIHPKYLNDPFTIKKCKCCVTTPL